MLADRRASMSMDIDTGLPSVTPDVRHRHLTPASFLALPPPPVLMQGAEHAG